MVKPVMSYNSGANMGPYVDRGVVYNIYVAYYICMYVCMYVCTYVYSVGSNTMSAELHAVPEIWVQFGFCVWVSKCGIVT